MADGEETMNVDDSSSSLQLDEQQAVIQQKPVIVYHKRKEKAVIEQHYNLIETSEEMNVVNPSSILQVNENVDSSSSLQVDEDEVTERENLTEAFIDLNVDPSSSLLLPIKEAIQENNLKEVDSPPSVLQVDKGLAVIEEEEGQIKASEEVNVDSSLLVPVIEEVIQENKLKEVDSPSLLQADEELAVNEEEEDLIKASEEVNVDSSLLVPVIEELIQENNLTEVLDSSSLIQVEEEQKVVDEEEGPNKASVEVNVDSSLLVPVIEEIIQENNLTEVLDSSVIEEENLEISSADMNVDSFTFVPVIEEGNIEKIDSSFLHQVDEVQVAVKEEENLIKVSADMDVDSSAGHALEEEVIEEEIEEENLKNVDASTAHAEVEEVVAEETEEENLNNVDASAAHALVDSSMLIPEALDSSSSIQVDKEQKLVDEENLERASAYMDVDSSMLIPVNEEAELEKTDSSSLLQVDEVPVAVEEENLIKASTDMDVDSSAGHALGEEVVAEEIEDENVDSSAAHAVVKEVVAEEIEENLKVVDASAAHLVVKEVIAGGIEEENINNADASAAHAVVQEVTAEDNEEENLKNVDASAAHPFVKEVIAEGVKEENLNSADASIAHALVEEVIAEDNAEENLKNVDASAAHAVVEELIAEEGEEENRNNVDASAAHALVKEVVAEETEEKNLKNVDSFSLPQVGVAIVNDDEDLVKASTEMNADLSSIIPVSEEATLIKADASSFLEVDEEESIEKASNDTNVDSTSISASPMEEDEEEEEAIPTEDVVQALLEHLVEPVLPTNSSSSGTPDDTTSLLIAKQMHAVVLLYNYYHRKQFPHLEFLDFESFCKVSVNAAPGLCGHMNHMQISKSVSDESENLLSPTEKAIQDACNISLALDASKDAPCTDGWPVSKVAIFLTDSTNNCFLVFSATTEGVWSLIEKTIDDSDRKLEDKLEKLEGNKNNKIRKGLLGGDINADQVSFRKLAFSIVQEATGIDRADLRVLENRVVPSLSAEKSTACFYLMKCIKPFPEDLTQVPIEDAINSLHGPLVKMEYGSCSVCEVVNYFHLLPYAGVLSDWLPRSGLEEANMEDCLETDDSDSDSSTLLPVMEEVIEEQKVDNVDSSTLLQVDEEIVVEEEAENLIRASTDIIEEVAGEENTQKVDSSSLLHGEEEVVIQEQEDMNVESSSIPSVVEQVIEEKSLRKDFNEMSVDSSSNAASVMEEAIATENVDTSSLLQVNEDDVIEAFKDMNVDPSSVLPTIQQVIQENNLKEVYSPSLLQVDEEPVVVEEEGLIKASADVNVDSSALVPVIVGRHLEKTESSSSLQVDEVPVVMEGEENLIKASADMDVDSSAVHEVVEEVLVEGIEEENLKNVNSSSVLQVDVAVVTEEENLVEASTEMNMDISSIIPVSEEATLKKADSSFLPKVDEGESLQIASDEMNIDSTSVSASVVEEEEAIQTEDVVQALLEYLVEPVLPVKSSFSGSPDDPASLLVAKQMHAVVLLYNYYHRKQFPHLEFLDFESFCKVSVNAIPGLCGHMKFMQTCKSISDKPEDLLSPTEKAIKDACNISIELDASKDAPCTDGWPVSKVAIFLTDSTKNCFLVFNATTHGVWSLIEKTNDYSNGKLEDKLEKLNGNKKSKLRKWPPGGDIKADQVSFRQLAFSIVEESTGIGRPDLRVLENHVVPSLSAEKSTASFFLMKCIKPFREDLTRVPIEDVIIRLRGPLVKMEYGCCSVCEVVNYFHLLPYAGILSDWLPRAGLEEANMEDCVETDDSDSDSSSVLPVMDEVIEEQKVDNVDSSTLVQVDEEVVVEEEAENLNKASANIVEEVTGEETTQKADSSSLLQVCEEVVTQVENTIKLPTDMNVESCSIPPVVEKIIEEESLRKDSYERNVDNSSISASFMEEAISADNVVQALLDYLVVPALPALHVISSSSKVLDDSSSLSLENSIAKQMHAVVLLYNYYHRKQFPHLEFLDFESFCKVSVNATPGLLEHMKFMQRCKSLSNEPEDLLSPTEKAIQDACKISLSLDASKDAPCTEGWPVSKVAVFLMDSMRNCFLVYGSTTQGVWSLIEEANDCFSNKLEDKSEKQKGNKKKKIRKWPSGGDINADEVSYRRIAFSIVKEATGIGHADLRVLRREVVPSLIAEKSTACFYLMKYTKPFHEDLTQVPIEDAINSLHGPLVKMEYGSCSVCEVVNYFHLLPYATVLSDWLPRAGLEEANIDYSIETDDSDREILVESCETPAIPSTSNIVVNKKRKSPAEKVNKNWTHERLNKNSTTERVNKNSTTERVNSTTTERGNADRNVATTNKDPVIHIHKKMKSSIDSNYRSTRKRVGIYEVPLVQVDRVDSAKEAAICGRTTSAEVPCANINLNMGNSGEEENPREQAYEFITQNLQKKPRILPSKMREMLQVILKMLHTRCNELSGLQRDLQDHIAICERYLRTMPNDGDLTEKLESILNACTTAITRASLQNSTESDPHFGTLNLPQDMKSKKLSEAVLNLPNACKDLDTICRQNNWTLPTYNLLLSNGGEGFHARVVVQGLDFECSEGGHVKPDPREARESAAARVLTKMHAMQQGDAFS
ncbi:uncharacterized protein LOC113317041 isoform X2 [Papaver somniferum]|uniref:uncharacterized protein LOC113317041 isoform X2 n=1 Tax=Papaver somniferum TaxID=3469 RepID=UPI000E6FCF3A|nr:uncharacterized protein LOC113317041 isoform X2 [Papaver somniferum]